MNVGIVTTWFERGAAYVSRQYAQALRHDHEVFIYARGGEGRAVGDPSWDDGSSITWGKDLSRLGFQWIDLADFEKWLRTKRIEVVLFNEQAWWPPILLCRRLGIKTAAYVDYYTEETIPFFRAYDLLICNTRRHRSAFDWHPQCAYLPWGTETDIFRPQTLDRVENGSVTFFHSCGMNPKRKGTDFLLRAFQTLDAPNARLVIHSQVEIERLLPEQREGLVQLKSKGRLTVRRETVGPPGLYHLGDVYVYPSRLDGIGLTIAEAMACGLPVIVTDAPPMNEFIQEDIGRAISVSRWSARADGYYWPQATVDLDSLRQCLQYYIDRSDQVPGFKRMARDYAERSLNWTKNAEPLPDLIKNSHMLDVREMDDLEARIDRYEQNRMSLKARFYLKAPQVAGALLSVGQRI